MVMHCEVNGEFKNEVSSETIYNLLAGMYSIVRLKWPYFPLVGSSHAIQTLRLSRPVR